MRLDRVLSNIRHGRLQRSLSLAAAAAAAPLTFEIYLEHYRGSFGDAWEWVPLVAAPPVVAAGIGGVFSPRAARTALPAACVTYALIGAAGTALHARGVARRPGGFHEAGYNLVMGPPLLAPGSLALVGAMGVLAALMERER